VNAPEQIFGLKRILEAVEILGGEIEELTPHEVIA
jgi:hypothetical protein